MARIRSLRWCTRRGTSCLQATHEKKLARDLKRPETVNSPSGDVNSYEPMMSITLLLGLSSVGGASFNVPVSSRFCPSDVSYLIVAEKLLSNYSRHDIQPAQHLQEIVSILLDVVDELDRLDWSLGGGIGACDQQGKCNL